MAYRCATLGAVLYTPVYEIHLIPPGLGQGAVARRFAPGVFDIVNGFLIDAVEHRFILVYGLILSCDTTDILCLAEITSATEATG